MHGFVQKVQKHVLNHQLIDPTHSVVAAVSGGADSVAMALALHASQYHLSLAYVDHGTRPETVQWGDFVGSLAEQLGCNFFRLCCDPGRGSEAELRDGRYAALDTLDADRIATAHTANDQAETVLMRLIRGAGTSGLAAIPPQRGRVVRPMLAVTRADVLAFLGNQKQEFVKDPSNAGLDRLRNRIRQVLLPLLESDFQPNIVRLLATTADILRGERNLLEQLANDHLEQHELAIGPLREIHPALRAHVLRKASPVSINAERLSAMERLIHKRGWVVQLEGGVTVEAPSGGQSLIFLGTKSDNSKGMT